MNELGKGIGVGLTAMAIAYVAVQLNNPYICWAFIVCAAMACDWRTGK
jgi:hypothetical protein